ncbi:hypothetical protein [Halomonas sp. MCCC 1A11062]|uniref:hypothetical protein n=1 Tax=Halomonas sp. MCCC 1A11062 TaxID=2733485 RepID=UPI001F3DFE69|nr:hypothetical protein [Halomonas sp. MCCC 1A11062]MCE8036116.1 hypothetical protein [Halomonas sp. MCCC 1A11062]
MSLSSEYSLRPPVGRITQTANRLLVRALEALFSLWGLLAVGACVLAGIALMVAGSWANGFLLIIAPFGLLFAIGLAWLAIATYLLMLFGEHESGRTFAMFILAMFVLPPMVLSVMYDTLLFRVMSPSLSATVLTGMTVGLLILGLFVVNQALARWSHRIDLLAHGLNLLLVLAVVELTFPYRETLLTHVQTSKCHTVESTLRSGIKQSGTICLASFSIDGKTREIWISPGARRSVRVRHGIFNHYR